MWWLSLITNLITALSCRQILKCTIKGVWYVYCLLYRVTVTECNASWAVSYTDTPRKGQDFYTTWLQTHTWKETPGSDSVALSVVIMLPTIQKNLQLQNQNKVKFPLKKTNTEKNKKRKELNSPQNSSSEEKRRVNTSRFSCALEWDSFPELQIILC